MVRIFKSHLIIFELCSVSRIYLTTMFIIHQKLAFQDSNATSLCSTPRSPWPNPTHCWTHCSSNRPSGRSAQGLCLCYLFSVWKQMSLQKAVGLVPLCPFSLWVPCEASAMGILSYPLAVSILYVKRAAPGLSYH